MATAVESISADLASIVGESHATCDPHICAAYAAGGVVPGCAAFPGSADEVASVLQYASTRSLAVIPCRNATKLSLGNPPRKYDIALSLKELNNVWHYEPSDLTAGVEPGIKFGDFQRFVGRDNLWLPIDPEGGDRASIGGILATNSAGPLRHAFGSPRDMTLGMRIATADGKIVKAGGRVVKNVAGYDLSKLIIGSHGTLGVIVEANFKLFPRPAGRASFGFSVGSLDTARDLRRRLNRSSLPIIRMVLADDLAASWARGEAEASPQADGPELWVEAAGSVRVIQRVRRELEAAGRETGAQLRERDEEESASFWDRIADFRQHAAELRPDALAAKFSIPVSLQEDFLAQAEALALNECTPLAWINQAGTGIVQLSVPEFKESERARAFAARLRKAADENSGKLVSMEGPREAAAQNDAWGMPGDDFEMMKKVKQAWDPQNILSPGRFLGGI